MKTPRLIAAAALIALSACGPESGNEQQAIKDYCQRHHMGWQFVSAGIFRPDESNVVCVKRPTSYP